MKKLKVILVILLTTLLAIFVVIEVRNRITEGKVVDSNRSRNVETLSYISVGGQYKKIPDYLFLNQDSLYISNDDFRGKVYVAEFFFTRCPSICPIMNQNMKKIEDKYGHHDDFGIASFSIDPDNDTPTVLKEYSQRYDVWSENWHFLTGSIDSIYSLANRGFNIYTDINPSVPGGFEHQGYFALIDREGYVRSRIDQVGNPIVYYSGIDQEGKEVQDLQLLIEDIEVLLNE